LRGAFGRGGRRVAVVAVAGIVRVRERLRHGVVIPRRLATSRVGCLLRWLLSIQSFGG
jgi:hypothetical protein